MYTEFGSIRADGERLSGAWVAGLGQRPTLVGLGRWRLHGSYREDGLLGGSPPDPRAGTVSFYIAVTDPDALHARAARAGPEVVRELTQTDHGSREFSVRDPEGNLWSFGAYRPA